MYLTELNLCNCYERAFSYVYFNFVGLCPVFRFVVLLGGFIECLLHFLLKSVVNREDKVGLSTLS